MGIGLSGYVPKSIKKLYEDETIENIKLLVYSVIVCDGVLLGIPLLIKHYFG